MKKLIKLTAITLASILISSRTNAESMPLKAWGPIQIGETTEEALQTHYDSGDGYASLQEGVVVLYTNIGKKRARIDALTSNGIVSDVYISIFPNLSDDYDCKKLVDTYTAELKDEYKGKIISMHTDDFDVIPFSDKQYKGILNIIMVSDENYINIIERKYNETSCKVTISFEHH